MKYLLDTNVISETWKPKPDATVREWLEAHGEDCGVPAPVLAEIADGIFAESGPRRDALLRKLHRFLAEWGEHVVPWDAAATLSWGQQQHSAPLKRQPQPLWDSVIEALALSRGLVVVTRNTGDFRQAQTLNPWAS